MQARCTAVPVTTETRALVTLVGSVWCWEEHPPWTQTDSGFTPGAIMCLAGLQLAHVVPSCGLQKGTPILDLMGQSQAFLQSEQT